MLLFGSLSGKYKHQFKRNKLFSLLRQAGLATPYLLWLSPYRIGFVHTQPTALVFFPVYGLNHFVRRTFINFPPAIPLFHIDTPQDLFT